MPSLTIEIASMTVLGSKRSMIGWFAHMDIEGGESFCRIGQTVEQFLENYPTRQALLEDVLGSPQFQDIRAKTEVVNGVPTVVKSCALLSYIEFMGDDIYNEAVSPEAQDHE
jgi:hypothetical protein